MSLPRIVLAAALLTVACGSHPSTAGDGGPRGGDAGPDTDAGPPMPIPAPLLRLGNDPKDGTSHTTTYQGVIVSDSAPTQVPASLASLSPAEELSVETGSGGETNLFYTLPQPFFLPVTAQEQISVTYAELVWAASESGYGVELKSLLDGSLIVLIDDGEYGSAFGPNNPLGFTFTPDTQPSGEESDPCGMKVHYPALVTQGQETRRLFPGQADQFTLSDGTVVTLTLFDLWKITGDTCGTAPDYSIVYFVEPSSM